MTFSVVVEEYASIIVGEYEITIRSTDTPTIKHILDSAGILKWAKDNNEIAQIEDHIIKVTAIHVSNIRKQNAVLVVLRALLDAGWHYTGRHGDIEHLSRYKYR